MSIRKKFAWSSVWVVVGRGSTNIMSFVVFAVLARYLGPADIGLVAFSAVFIDLTRSLALAGAPEALVRRESWDNRVSSTAFLLNVALSCAFTVVVAGGLGPLLAWLYDPRIGPIIAALALTFVIDAARATHEAKLQREFGFKTIALRSFVASLIGGVVGVAAAANGWGAWALVASRLVNSTVQTLFVWHAVHWMPQWCFVRDEARGILSFGWRLSASAVFGQLNRRVAEIVVGTFLGPVGLGLYRVGSRAVDMLNDVFIAPMQQTALAAFSRLPGSDAIGASYLRLVRVNGLIAFPAFFGAACIAPEFVILCFGDRWAQSGLIMAFLAIQGGAAFTVFSLAAMTATGHSSLAAYQGAVNLVTNTIIALLFVRFGVEWVALGFTLGTYLTLPFRLLLLKKAIGLPVREVLMVLLPSCVSAIIMTGVLVAARQTVLSDISPLFRLGAMVSLGVLSYSAAIFCIGRVHAIRAFDDLKAVVARN